MDISGGLPAVIIKTLVASAPGRLQLLPALPRAWPTGAIEGVLCRGQIEIVRLEWATDGLSCTLRSDRAQTVTLELPAPVTAISVEGAGGRVARGDGPNQRRLTLPSGQPVTVKITGGLAGDGKRDGGG